MISFPAAGRPRQNNTSKNNTRSQIQFSQGDPSGLLNSIYIVKYHRVGMAVKKNFWASQIYF
jgi:hypothetical protein